MNNTQPNTKGETMTFSREDLQMRKSSFMQKFHEADFDSPQGYNRYFVVGHILFQYDESATTAPTTVNTGYSNTEAVSKTGYKEVLELGWCVVDQNDNRLLADGYSSRDDLVRNRLWSECRDLLKKSILD